MMKHNDSQIIRYFLEYNEKLLRHVYHSEMYFAMQTKYILLKHGVHLYFLIQIKIEWQTFSWYNAIGNPLWSKEYQ